MNYLSQNKSQILKIFSQIPSMKLNIMQRKQFLHAELKKDYLIDLNLHEQP